MSSCNGSGAATAELEEEVILALFCIDPKTDQVFRYHDYGVNPERAIISAKGVEEVNGHDPTVDGRRAVFCGWLVFGETFQDSGRAPFRVSLRNHQRSRASAGAKCRRSSRLS